MIDISDKTYAKILEALLSYVPDDLNKREGSLIRTSLAACAWAIEGMYLDLAYVQAQSYGETASTEYLDYIAAEQGLTRKPATSAVRYARFNMSPPVGTQFRLNGTGENIYYTLLTAATNSPDASYPDNPYLGEVTCTEAGTIGNVYSGSLGTVNFVAGLTSAILLGVVTPGTDVETDDSLRSRWKDSVGRVDFAGNIQAYRNYILSQPGIGAVQVYPTYQGPGTVLCSAISSDYEPLTTAQVNALQLLVCPPEDSGSNPSANGYGMAPVGAVVKITTPTAVGVDVTANVKILSSSSRTIAEIQEEAEEKIAAYIKSICAEWGTMSEWNVASYSLILYLNKVLGILNNIDGVEVASSILINGESQNLVFNQINVVGGQTIPVLNSVALTQI